MTIALSATRRLVVLCGLTLSAATLEYRLAWRGSEEES